MHVYMHVEVCCIQSAHVSDICCSRASRSSDNRAVPRACMILNRGFAALPRQPGSPRTSRHHGVRVADSNNVFRFRVPGPGERPTVSSNNCCLLSDRADQHMPVPTVTVQASSRTLGLRASTRPSHELVRRQPDRACPSDCQTHRGWLIPTSCGMFSFSASDHTAIGRLIFFSSHVARGGMLCAARKTQLRLSR